MKFLNVIVILFLHCYRLRWEMKPHHGLMRWNFIPDLKFLYKQPLRQSFLRKWFNHFRKRLYLGCFTGSWMRLCCVHDNYVSVKFLTQPYLLLFLDFSGDSKVRLFQLFRFSMKLIHLHYNWQQNLNKKFGDIFRSVPTYLRDVSLGHKIKNYRY